MKGKNISGASTLKSMYDHDCIEIRVGSTQYRMHTSVIVEMAQQFDFDTEKLRIHTYLINPKLREEVK